MTAEQKRKVLVFIDWYLPGYKAGGPIRSCANLVSRMEPHFHFKVITGDTDLGEKKPYDSIKINQWNRLAGGEEVFYCSKSFLTHANLEKLVREERPDVIYLNSMFSQWFTLVPLIVAKRYGKAKVVLAPRGMLSPGALMLKATKKRMFLSFAKVMGLFNRVTWHASTVVEVAEIHNKFGKRINVVHAMNLTPLRKPVQNQRRKEPGAVNLVYIGRISEVKNLLQNLEALRELPNTCKVSFDIYGPVDDATYYEKCKAAIAMLPDHITAHYMGPIGNESVPEVLSTAHFLYLLTFNENFGHAIVEGFTAGCPVIISNRTPWKQLEKKECGWDLELTNKPSIINALKQACNMDQQQYDSWSKNASALAESVNNSQEHMSNTMKLFS